MILLSFDSTLYREDTWIALAALWKYFNFHGYISQYCTSSDMSLRNHSNLNISVKSIKDKHLRINSRVPVYLEKKNENMPYLYSDRRHKKSPP